ncbi:MAG: GNAT family N-acetyltransferase [Velocimicrobium sp.]
MDLNYETKRLILRVLDASDAEKVCLFYQKNKYTFEPVEPPRVPNFYTLNFHKSNLSVEYNEFIHGRYLRLFLFEKNHPETIIGSLCFNNFRNGCFKSCVVGYKMDHNHCNLGYMSEGLNFAIQHILAKEYAIHRIEAMVLPNNNASIHLLEKLGFVNEGITRDYANLNGIWRNHFRYSMLVYQ